jgi:thioredoxin 1
MLEVTSKKQFELILGKYPIVILDVYATWCQPCKVLAPRLDDLEQAFKDVTGVKFCKSDIENQLFNVTGLPTILFFKGGQQVNMVTGADFTKIEQTLRSLVPNAPVTRNESVNTQPKYSSSRGSIYKTWGTL